jgi:hypothetical protein
MHDIFAIPDLSNCSARKFDIWAALEHPEQEYTIGKDSSGISHLCFTLQNYKIFIKKDNFIFFYMGLEKGDFFI